MARGDPTQSKESLTRPGDARSRLSHGRIRVPADLVACLPVAYFWILKGDDMEEARHAPAIIVDVARLKPQEIVLLARIATGAQTEGFPELDRCAEDFWR